VVGSALPENCIQIYNLLSILLINKHIKYIWAFFRNIQVMLTDDPAQATELLEFPMNPSANRRLQLSNAGNRAEHGPDSPSAGRIREFFQSSGNQRTGNGQAL
jgi:hypothetical protein